MSHKVNNPRDESQNDAINNLTTTTHNRDLLLDKSENFQVKVEEMLQPFNEADGPSAIAGNVGNASFND